MKLSKDAVHAWHVWMNKRQDSRAQTGDPRERSLYEFKDLLSYLEYGHVRIQQAFEGKLRTTHQQCSHQSVEQLPQNSLCCCLGTDVAKCPILLDAKQHIEAEDARRVAWYRDHIQKEKPPLGDEVFKILSAICGWHIYSEATKNPHGWSGVDTSEGYHLDESDRRFWERTYASMAACSDPDDEDGPIPETEGRESLSESFPCPSACDQKEQNAE